MHIFQYLQSAHMPQICKRDLVPPDFNDNSALMYSSSDLYVQPEDDLTGRGRNMQLAETFIHTTTPCILHEYSCILTAILYEFVYLHQLILYDCQQTWVCYCLLHFRTLFAPILPSKTARFPSSKSPVISFNRGGLSTAVM